MQLLFRMYLREFGIYNMNSFVMKMFLSANNDKISGGCNGSKWAYTEVVNKVSELNKTFYIYAK